MPDDQSQTDSGTTSAAQDNPASAAAADVVQQEIDQLKQSLQSEQSARIQLMADFDNFRKRMEAEKSKFGALANMHLIIQLLDVVDDVQLAKNDSELQSGRGQEILQIITDKLIASLNSVGVDRVELSQGDKFDPMSMEAITTIPTDNQEQDNTVAQVVSSAFKFRQEGTLLKSAKVVVYKYKPSN